MRYALLLLALTCSGAKISATGDSLHYLLPRDTVFLSMGEFEQKFFSHTIEAKQTLFSLAQFYGLSVEELYYFNPELINGITKLGQAIRVPIPNRAILRYKAQGFNELAHAPVYYVVRKGDTMYRISKHYFRMPQEEIMARNGLPDISIKPGQCLHVGWISTAGVPEEFRQASGGPLSRRNNALRKIFLGEAAGKQERENHGVAFWQKESKEDSDFYALHRYARVNSIISVTNPMTNRTVYVKVIGKMPDTVYERSVAVVLSPLAAKLLGAKDPRFFVRVKYY